MGTPTQATTRLLRSSSKCVYDRLFRHASHSPAVRFSSGSSFQFSRTSTQLETHLSGNQWNDCTFIHRASKDACLGRSPSLQHRHYGSASTLVQRNSSFSELKSDDVTYFKSILGDTNVVQDEDRLQVANTDWMNKYRGSSKLLLLPRTTEEVSHILKYCNSRCLAVVPQGGNTGLVGGSVPVYDEVIINMGLMNNIISFNEVSGILVCEAGCILENLETFLESKGFIMPLDLGSKGSCQIGGNVSTNAGGLRLVRYGSLHGNVLGIEAVLANGTVLDLLGTLRKDNTGYDLKHLFIGGEGSLGIVTKVSIFTPPKLSSINVAFLACADYLSCQKLLREAKRKLGEILSAFELLDEESMGLVLNHSEGLRNPLPKMYKFYVLIETTGSNESNDKEKLEAFLMHTMESGLLLDGTIAQDMNQTSSFWRVREGIAEALMKAGACYKYDVSLPVEKMYDLVEEMRKRLGKHGDQLVMLTWDFEGGKLSLFSYLDSDLGILTAQRVSLFYLLGDSAKVVGYGHMGDGNLHLNVSASQYDDAILAKIEPFVYEWTSKHRGSISAEHGMGLMKANKIYYSKSPAAVQLMSSVKKLLDPNRILNPYKVLPHSLGGN